MEDSSHDLNRLSAFVEHRLEGAEYRAVIDHVAECDECRSVVALLVRGNLQTAAAPRSTLVADVRRWAPLAAAAALAVIVGGVYLYNKPQPSPGDTPSSVPNSTPPPSVTPSPSTVPPSSAAPSGPTAAPTPAPGTPQSTSKPPVLRNAETRKVGAKRFRLVAGEWIDLTYDPANALPVTTIRTSAERTQTVGAQPALTPYLKLGRFTVVLDGQVYRVDIQ